MSGYWRRRRSDTAPDIAQAQHEAVGELVIAWWGEIRHLAVLAMVTSDAEAARAFDSLKSEYSDRYDRIMNAWHVERHRPHRTRDVVVEQEYAVLRKCLGDARRAYRASSDEDVGVVAAEKIVRSAMHGYFQELHTSIVIADRANEGAWPDFAPVDIHHQQRARSAATLMLMRPGVGQQSVRRATKGVSAMGAGLMAAFEARCMPLVGTVVKLMTMMDDVLLATLRISRPLAWSLDKAIDTRSGLPPALAACVLVAHLHGYDELHRIRNLVTRYAEHDGEDARRERADPRRDGRRRGAGTARPASPARASAKRKACS
ncbi:MAG: hypothetical protein HY825_16135 [Acidobacteria bacterium]|nr:hypothetical protein [Acidobacteriota bacterium]